MNVRSKCQMCAVRMSALCSAASEKAAGDLARAFHRRRVPAGQIVYGGSQRSQTYSIIVSGVVKLVHAKHDGRNQIVGLQFPSQFVGRPYSESSPLMAEAATDLEVCSFSGRVFEGLLAEHPEIERALLQRTLEDLDNAREWMFMIGRKTAEERVASLLLMIAKNMTDPMDNNDNAPPEECEFDLPLSRTEMAECLGLRLETVSRQFAHLRTQGIISTGRRRALRVSAVSELRRLCEAGVE